MSSFISFHSLLTVDDFTSCFNAVTEASKREVVANRLAESIIVNKSVVYNFDASSNCWVEISRPSSKPKDIISPIIDSFIAKSIELLMSTSTDDKKNFEILRNSFDGEFEKARNGKYVKNIDFYLGALTREEIVFDNDPDGIHFLNGRFNLRSSFFEENGRTKSSYISTILPYDWEPTTSEDSDAFIGLLMTTFREPEAFQFILYYIGKCLTTRSSADCEFLIQYGRGGGGKSTLLNILKTVFCDGKYVKSVNHNTFDNDAEFIKTIRGVNKSIRFLLVEEMHGNKKSLSNIKKVCDGSFALREKGLNSTVDFEINAKLFITTNSFLEFENDTGIMRRALYYEYKNHFTNDSTIVDNKSIFLRNPMLSREAIEGYSNRQKCAIFNCFAYFTRCYFDDNKTLRPPSVATGMELPTWEGFVRDFIKSDEGSRVTKTAMLSAVQSYFGFMKAIDEATMIKNLKNLGLVYEGTWQQNNQRGVFVNVTLLSSSNMELI